MMKVDPELAESVDLEHNLDVKKDKPKRKNKGKKDKKVKKDDIDSWDFQFKKDRDDKRKGQSTTRNLNLGEEDEWKMANPPGKKPRRTNNRGKNRGKIFPKNSSASQESQPQPDTKGNPLP